MKTMINSPIYLSYIPQHNVQIRLGTAAIISNKKKEVLLEQRADCGLWGIPGGAVEPGESVSTAIIREIREETGFIIEIDYLLGVYSEICMQRVILFPEGDTKHSIDVVVVGHIVEGKLQKSEESLDLAYFSVNSLPTNTLTASIKILEDYKLQLKGVLR